MAEGVVDTVTTTVVKAARTVTAKWWQVLLTLAVVMAVAMMIQYIFEPLRPGTWVVGGPLTRWKGNRAAKALAAQAATPAAQATAVNVSLSADGEAVPGAGV